jgi:hypothetical protein
VAPAPQKANPAAAYNNAQGNPSPAAGPFETNNGNLLPTARWLLSLKTSSSMSTGRETTWSRLTWKRSSALSRTHYGPLSGPTAAQMAPTRTWWSRTGRTRGHSAGKDPDRWHRDLLLHLSVAAAQGDGFHRLHWSRNPHHQNSWRSTGWNENVLP